MPFSEPRDLIHHLLQEGLAWMYSIVTWSHNSHLQKTPGLPPGAQETGSEFGLVPCLVRTPKVQHPSSSTAHAFLHPHSWSLRHLQASNSLTPPQGLQSPPDTRQGCRNMERPLTQTSLFIHNTMKGVEMTSGFPRLS